MPWPPSASPPFSGLDWTQCLLLAFALSFSSTVFAVKTLEEKGESQSLHGRIAVGILIMQDIFAVVFLTASSGKIPSLWALGLLGLPLLRPLLTALMDRCGHGELQVLLALMLSLGSAELFEAMKLKPDLGPLVFGVLVGSHPKSKELARILLGFKDLFLVGFFLKIGLSGTPDLASLGLAGLLLLVLPLKAGLFFVLLTRLQMRARSSLLTTLSLANYSEFGLIVGSVGAASGWIGSEWLVVIALALSASFVLGAPVNAGSHALYERFAGPLDGWEREGRLPEEARVSVGHAEVIVVGMGRVGTSAYDNMKERFGDVVVGIDSNPQKVEEHLTSGRRVILGDVTDPEFRDRLEHRAEAGLLLLTMPSPSEMLYVLEALKEEEPTPLIAVAARFEDERGEFERAGADFSFNVLGDAGAGFAAHVVQEMQARVGR